MNKVVLNKLAVFVLAMVSGAFFSIAYQTGELKDYIYGFVPFVIGLFYSFYNSEKK